MILDPANIVFYSNWNHTILNHINLLFVDEEPLSKLGTLSHQWLCYVDQVILNWSLVLTIPGMRSVRGKSVYPRLYQVFISHSVPSRLYSRWKANILK